MASPRFSVVVPVFNRPAEVEELLESLLRQSYSDFEILLIEDGSSVTSEKVYEKFSSRLNIQYFFKPNSGPGPSRNFGFQKSRGEYLVVFDSDCIVPPGYFQIVNDHLNQHHLDAWGGPDRGHEEFNFLQRAMAYTMSSTFTTGGIRGGREKNFQPRSFNMGISRRAYEKTGGFIFDRFAEDIELSIRLKKEDFKVGLIPGAFVYHKRRSSLKQFFRQVMNFGKGRIMVGRQHPGSIRLVHGLPALFLLGLVLLPVVLLFNYMSFYFLTGAFSLYFIVVTIDALVTTRSLAVALLAGPACFIQLTGYGLGFLKEWLRPSVRKGRTDKPKS